MSTDVKKWECPDCYNSFSDGGLCPHCKEIDGEEVALRPWQSEFGMGVAVCLVKFSEHLGNLWESKIWNFERWRKMGDVERAAVKVEIETHPNGDSARNYGDIDSLINIYGSYEKAVSDTILLWANGAGDHFLDLDREKSGPKMIELAEAVLEMRFGHSSERVYTADDMKRIHVLWREATLELDEQHGVECQWGQF